MSRLARSMLAFSCVFSDLFAVVCFCVFFCSTAKSMFDVLACFILICCTVKFSSRWMSSFIELYSNLANKTFD